MLWCSFPSASSGLSGCPGEKARFVLIEDVLLAVGLSELFPGMTPLGHGVFRALRDSDIEIEEKAQDLVVMFESALKRRRRGQIIRLTFSAGTPERLRDFVIEQTGTRPQDVVVLDGMVALSDIRELITLGPAGPAVSAVHGPLSGANKGLWRGLFRRDPRERHRRPSSVRIFRCGRAVLAAGGG